MKLVVSIDTEEDNWNRFYQPFYPASNITHLPSLHQELIDSGARPTYLVSYCVVKDREATAVLGSFGGDSCEIGAHCHPWNNPPFEEPKTPASTMLCNLPRSLQRRKLEKLTEAIASSLKLSPTSFRAGRWGFCASMAELLLSLGYTVDSSVTPYVDWRPCHGPDFSEQKRVSSYRLYPNGISSSPQFLTEVPATIGYLQNDEARANCRFHWLAHSRLRRVKLAGALSTIGALNRIWLSPELQTLRQMQQLALKLEERGENVLNMVFHSSSLACGLTPFVQTEKMRLQFVSRIMGFIEFAKERGYQFATLSEAAEAPTIFSDRKVIEAREPVASLSQEPA